MLNHSELSVWDLIIVGIYLLAMVFIGVYAIRRIKNSKDYYVAGRSFGPMVLMATVCATIIGGSGLMGRAGVAYSSGTKAILTAVPYLLGMFIFSGISGRISKLGMKICGSQWIWHRELQTGRWRRDSGFPAGPCFRRSTACRRRPCARQCGCWRT